MTQRLIIHAGTEKTGSTSLQNSLLANREYLRQNGICYPLVGPRLTRKWNAERTGNGTFVGAYVNEQGSGGQQEFESLLSDFVKQAGTRSVILSNETIYLGAPERLQHLLEWTRGPALEVEICVIVRPLQNYLLSQYRHMTRHNGVHSAFSDFLISHKTRIAEGLENLSRIFGAENLRVLIYRSSHDESIASFGQMIGAPLSVGKTLVHNRSLDPFEAAMVQYLSRKGIDAAIGARLSRDLTAQPANMDTGEEIIIQLSNETRERLQSETDEINTFIGGDDILPDIPEKLTIREVPATHLTEEHKKLLNIIADLYKSNSELKEKSDLIRIWRSLRSPGSWRHKVAHLKNTYMK